MGVWKTTSEHLKVGPTQTTPTCPRRQHDLDETTTYTTQPTAPSLTRHGVQRLHLHDTAYSELHLHDTAYSAFTLTWLLWSLSSTLSSCERSPSLSTSVWQYGLFCTSVATREHAAARTCALSSCRTRGNNSKPPILCRSEKQSALCHWTSVMVLRWSRHSLWKISLQKNVDRKVASRPRSHSFETCEGETDRLHVCATH